MKQGGLSPWLCLEHISLYPLYFQSYFRIPSHAQCSPHSQCYFANRHILTRAFSIDRAHTAFTLAEFVQLLIPSLPSYVIRPSHSRLHIPASQKVSITDQQKVEQTTKIAQNRKGIAKLLPDNEHATAFTSVEETKPISNVFFDLFFSNFYFFANF